MKVEPGENKKRPNCPFCKMMGNPGFLILEFEYNPRYRVSIKKDESEIFKKMKDFLKATKGVEIDIDNNFEIVCLNCSHRWPF